MCHIVKHILEGSQPKDRVPDPLVAAHLRQKGMIDEQTYLKWMKPSEKPSNSGEESHRKQEPQVNKQASMAPLTKPKSTEEDFEAQPVPRWDLSTF